MRAFARLRQNDKTRSILSLLAMLIIPAEAAPMAQKTVTFSISSDPEVIYNYQTQRCDWRSIPDSPARAYRRADGSIVLIAAHFRNRILEGSSFDNLRPNCAVLSQGAESANPADYDDRFWIQSLIPLSDGRILGLASQEYSGLRHKGVCEKGPDRPECWYLALVGLEANDRDFSFKLLPHPQRVIAGSNRRFDPSVDAAGFLTLTNTVLDGDFAYFIAWTEDAAEPGRRGNCLFRAPRRNLETGWKMLRKGQFVSPPKPYPAGTDNPVPAKCDRLGDPGMVGKIRSLVWLETKNMWLAVWSTRVNGTGGIYYATSHDLRNWSPSSLLALLEPPWGSDRNGVFYDYPSAIDHHSSSPIFQTIGDSFHLYLTRLNWEQRHTRMDRDLVRFKVVLD
jgi:hypothetical protein